MKLEPPSPETRIKNSKTDITAHKSDHVLSVSLLFFGRTGLWGIYKLVPSPPHYCINTTELLWSVVSDGKHATKPNTVGTTCWVCLNTVLGR